MSMMRVGLILSLLLCVSITSRAQDAGSSKPYGGRDYHPAPNMSASEITQSVESKQPYALFKQGTKATYRMEWKGKYRTWQISSMSYIQQEVAKVAVENGVYVAYVQINYLNKKKKLSAGASMFGKNLISRLFKNEFDPSGNYHLVNNVVFDALDRFKERRGFGIFLPSDLQPGMKLDCGTISEMTAGDMGGYRPASMVYTDWEVLGSGQLTVPAGTFECVKLRGQVDHLFNARSISESKDVTMWVARGIGIIRYDVGDAKYVLYEIENN